MRPRSQSREECQLLGLVRQFVNSSVPRTNQNKVTNSARLRCSQKNPPRLPSRLFCRGSLPVQVESLIIPVGRGRGLSIWLLRVLVLNLRSASRRQYSVPPRGANTPFRLGAPKPRSASGRQYPVPPRGAIRSGCLLQQVSLRHELTRLIACTFRETRRSQRHLFSYSDA
jgi:hypothetical protein